MRVFMCQHQFTDRIVEIVIVYRLMSNPQNESAETRLHLDQCCFVKYDYQNVNSSHCPLHVLLRVNVNSSLYVEGVTSPCSKCWLSGRCDSYVLLYIHGWRCTILKGLKLMWIDWSNKKKSHSLFNFEIFDGPLSISWHHGGLMQTWTDLYIWF